MPKAQDTWTDRVWREFHADNLTRTHRDVLLTLRTFRGTGGVLWPSHATLADRVGCCIRTVQRALEQAQRLGLVSWAERRMRAAWRWLRTSNLYRLLMPAEPVQAGQRTPVFRALATTGHLDRGGESQNKKEALRELMTQAVGMPDLLALRREAFRSSYRATAPDYA
jgi:DNA-binding transcriptional MocR family regulator